MCLGVPLKIVSIENDKEALGEMNGIEKKIRIDLLPDIKCGDYVMVHAGFALEKIDESLAKDTLDALEEVRKMMADK
ncbi:HypC/HybG/HupF family hydrogenase formation chaperone [Clostridium thermarum]|uniref:HypC/HybG/HupF family hydrogenase formation chaperone n=1 Tax=Clostridium thermarum TaxID=1716543 RepID=UPI0013D25CAD|nr:HypC/HybG/HupF family hydrogenase formation chaperone [Clostridium thermarum]